MLNFKDLQDALSILEKKKDKNFRYYFYDRDTVSQFDFFFNVSTRSNAKTTAYQRDIALHNFAYNKECFIKLVKYKDMTKAEYNADWFTEVIVAELKKRDIYIYYYNKKYYINQGDQFRDGMFSRKDFLKDAYLLGYVIPLYDVELYKSLNFEKCSTIVNDEFAKKNHPTLPFEVTNFLNLLSTVVRNHGKLKCYFNSNIVDPLNGYFRYFGINAFEIEEGHTYTFLADESNPDSAVVGVEFSKSVATDSKKLPKILQVKDNAEALGQKKKFDKPVEVVTYRSQIHLALQQGFFEDLYTVLGKCVISTDTESDFIKSGNKFVFDEFKSYLIEDTINSILYIIPEESTDGLQFSTDENLPEYKLADNDIRNDRQIFDLRPYKQIRYGDVNTYLHVKGLL